MRLIACHSCHAQYDVSDVLEKTVTCRCGESLANEELVGVDVAVHRCSSCGAGVAGEDPKCGFCGSEIVRDTGALSLICPECYARNEMAARFCGGCGVGFKPDEMPTDLPELPCPCCGSLMAVRAVGGVHVNECSNCNGLWAPDQRFDELVGRAAEAQRCSSGDGKYIPPPRMKGGNPARQAVQYRKCPVCEAFMQRRNFQKTSGVIIDRCQDHGAWLDADELERIAGFILSGGRPGASAMLVQDEARAEKALRAARRDNLLSGMGSGIGQTSRHSGAESAVSFVKLLWTLLD